MQLCNCLFALALLASPALHRQVAITFDDLPNLTADDDSVETTVAMMHALIAQIVRNGVPATGFVNESKLLDANEQPDARLVALLDDWLAAGLDLGNHTFSHASLTEMSLADYEADVIEGEHISRPLAEKRGRRYAFFRHPYLEAGRTPEEAEALNRFLAEHGYRAAPVTIDDSEWIFAEAYRNARSPITRWRIGRSYIDYMARRFAWYEARSRTVFGREIPQILLLHVDGLNARYLPRLVAMMRRRGYGFVTLDQAMRDPAYQSADAWRSEAGVSWIERWGVTRGIDQSLFEGDPQAPQWVQQLAGAKEQ